MELSRYTLVAMLVVLCGCQEGEISKRIGLSAVERPTAAERTGMRLLEGGRGEAPGEYKEPRGITLDSDGNIYVADFRNYRVQEFDPEGAFVATWGTKGSEPGQFNDPCDVAVDSEGRVYVADTFNNRIQVFDKEGKFLSLFAGGLYAPRGLAVDGRGMIWVADTGNGVVKVFSNEQRLLKTIGRIKEEKERISKPNGVALDSSGNVYVADAGEKLVRIFNSEGNPLSEFKVDGWEEGVFNEPYIAIGAGGDIYVTDPRGQRALRYSKDGQLLGVLKPMKGEKPLLLFPMGIAVEPAGDAVYIVDCRNNRVRKFSKSDFTK
jgi:tripartite motif-containing protein 71